MAEFLTNTADLTSVADAIRAKGGTSGQLVYPAGFVSAIQALQTGSVMQLIVRTQAGASVTAVKDSSTVSGTADTDGACTLELSEAGEWVVTAAKNGDSRSETILIGTQEVELTIINPTFAENTWEQIVAACQAGKVPDAWAVGDSKTMLIGETEYQVDIIGKNHDDLADGSGKAALTLQLHDCYGTKYSMNETGTNTGGWKSSVMRSTSLPAILALVPEEMQSGIREVSKKTSTGGASATIETVSDKLFLLSEVEVCGTEGDSAAGEGTQYAYYKDGPGNRKVKLRSGSLSSWWLRSPDSAATDAFCYMSAGAYVSTATSSQTIGVAFAFCL